MQIKRLLVIPARSGSKRIKNKILKNLGANLLLVTQFYQHLNLKFLIRL